MRAPGMRSKSNWSILLKFLQSSLKQVLSQTMLYRGANYILKFKAQQVYGGPYVTSFALKIGLLLTPPLIDRWRKIECPRYSILQSNPNTWKYPKYLNLKYPSNCSWFRDLGLQIKPVDPHKFKESNVRGNSKLIETVDCDRSLF